MYTECVKSLSGNKRRLWEALLASTQLRSDEEVEQTVLVWDGEKLAACGSRMGNVLKCIAVDPAYQGEGVTATVLTTLKQEAFDAGYTKLFLYTKPRNKYLFEPLFFYPVAQTGQVLLMENTRGGIRDYVNSLEVKHRGGIIGAIVMNADPFTEGHKYLVEQAAGECDWLYVFVLSEDRGFVRAEHRLEFVKAGTAGIPNVTVYETGPYLISSATFPSYFLKEKEQADQAHGELDLEIFNRWFVPRFGITHRFAGTEPNCKVTASYNTVMARKLPEANVRFREILRKEQGDVVVSASRVRRGIREKNEPAVESLVPKSTLEGLKKYKYL